MVPLLWWDFPPFNYSCCFHLKLIKCFRVANRAGLFRRSTQRHPAPARSGTFLFLFKGLRISFFQNGKKTTGFGALQGISGFCCTKKKWTPLPWDFLESVRSHQRRIHHPGFDYLLWMEKARTGKCCSLWKVLTVISVPGHLQWSREHLISKVKMLLYHLLGIKDPLPLLFSATFWCFSSIFIHPGKRSFQQHCSEVTIAQFWQCHNDIVFLPLSLWMPWRHHRPLMQSGFISSERCCCCCWEGWGFCSFCFNTSAALWCFRYPGRGVTLDGAVISVVGRGVITELPCS